MSSARRLEVARASLLNRKVHLARVTLFQVEARHLLAMETPRFSFSMTAEGVGWTRGPDLVAALFPLCVTIEHEAEDKTRTALARLRVVVQLGYNLESSFSAKDEGALEDYLGIVGWMHAWPYARAEIQDLSTRLGFPPLVLPVLLAGQTDKVPVTRIAQPPDATTVSKATPPAPSPTPDTTSTKRRRAPRRRAK